jgi:hypothetical protein
VQELELGGGGDDAEAVGLGRLGGEFGEEFGGGDADRAGDAVMARAISTGEPMRRRAPATSRKASSTEIGWTCGVYSRKIAMISRETSP